MTVLLSDPSFSPGVTWSAGEDTVRMPWSVEGEAPDTVVRPALAVLFRVAVGPEADYYVPRFVRREGNSATGPAWVWPAFFWPTVWAFYRQRWLAGAVFTALHVLGFIAFLLLEPVIGGGQLGAWLALAALVWVIPGTIAAVAAVPLLHRAVRRSVRKAEAMGGRADRVAALLTREYPTSVLNALLVGFAAVALWLAIALPRLEDVHDDRVVRGRVADSLAAVAPLTRAIDESRRRGTPLPVPEGDGELAAAPPGSRWLASVSVGTSSGRLWLTFAETVPAIAGKTLLLAPVVNEQQQLLWVCVPVDIPRRLLPRECRAV